MGWFTSKNLTDHFCEKSALLSLRSIPHPCLGSFAGAGPVINWIHNLQHHRSLFHLPTSRAYKNQSFRIPGFHLPPIPTSPPLPGAGSDPTRRWRCGGCAAGTPRASRRPRADPRRCAEEPPGPPAPSSAGSDVEPPGPGNGNGNDGDGNYGDRRFKSWEDEKEMTKSIGTVVVFFPERNEHEVQNYFKPLSWTVSNASIRMHMASDSG